MYIYYILTNIFKRIENIIRLTKNLASARLDFHDVWIFVGYSLYPKLFVAGKLDQETMQPYIAMITLGTFSQFRMQHSALSLNKSNRTGD